MSDPTAMHPWAAVEHADHADPWDIVHHEDAAAEPEPKEPKAAKPPRALPITKPPTARDNGGSVSNDSIEGMPPGHQAIVQAIAEMSDDVTNALREVAAAIQAQTAALLARATGT